MTLALAQTRAVLLRRRGLVFVDASADRPLHDHARPVAIELAGLGYVPSARLHARFSLVPLAELVELRDWMCGVLAARLGADRKHEPLFRRFPEDVPEDTLGLWIQKVLSHYLQSPEQPCLFCRRTGTTHVLRPCHHVVCDHCFDGSNYTACPVCEHHVDRSSPFFTASEVPAALPAETVRFKLLDLGEDLAGETRALFVAFCERVQPMSPADRDDLAVLLADHGEDVLTWIPERIPVKENVAAIFGALFRACDPDRVLAAARGHLKTATDVLRFVAVFSGADPSLQGRTVFATVSPDSRRWNRPVEPEPAKGRRGSRERKVPMLVHRFPVARMGRPLRRALLGLLDGMDPDQLVEDVLRHRSTWVWVAEFLHPHEYAARFPNATRAFAIARKQSPDGTPAPAFATFQHRVEAAAGAGDAAGMVELLRSRPGQLGRRLDHALRLAGDDRTTIDRVVAAFAASAPRLTTPMLLTLRAVLPTRTRPAGVRIYWPKGQVSRGVSSPDARAPLPARAAAEATRAVEAELLRRFADKPPFDACVIDAALADIVVPFNERTASRAAIDLPRGSRVPVAAGKVPRLFLHWCQPERGGHSTDLDLSVAFYDEAWRYVGVCSYYQLTFPTNKGPRVATSAGDLRNAPFPDGSTELVDIDRREARKLGVRYAVMVVTAYRGMPFDKLDRAFAGVMMREDVGGAHFDPRTVELKFALTGDSGVYLPLVFDIERDVVHWLDTYSKGMFELNNVETSRAAIATMCPELIEYFGSGVRSSMYDLALLHAAARGRQVLVRGPEPRAFTRRPGEAAADFLARITAGRSDGKSLAAPLPAASTFAALHRGDIDLPDGAVAYVLIPDRVTGTIAAGDLLS